MILVIIYGLIVCTFVYVAKCIYICLCIYAYMYYSLVWYAQNWNARVEEEVWRPELSLESSVAWEFHHQPLELQRLKTKGSNFHGGPFNELFLECIGPSVKGPLICSYSWALLWKYTCMLGGFTKWPDDGEFGGLVQGQCGDTKWTYSVGIYYTA